MTGTGVTQEGLTITSNAPYAVEFIQISGSDHKLVDNIIYGPTQSGPYTGWVTNRGFVTQPGTSNILVQNNVFYSLRQPAYLNPNSTGNSWGSPENAVDITLLAGTITGPPYDPIANLADNNSNVSISDQR